MSIGLQGSHMSPFNSSVELGFRALVLLNEVYPQEFSLRHLVIFDYLMVHSDDVEGGPIGLHPKTPYRSGELLVRRELLQDGILLFHSRGLIDRRYREAGVFYVASDKTESFLAVIETGYCYRLTSRAEWVASAFHGVPIESLEDLVSTNLGRWGAEFEMASVLWSETDGG